VLWNGYRGRPAPMSGGGVLLYDVVLPNWSQETPPWLPFRDRIPRASAREIEEHDRREWIQGIKERLLLVTAGDAPQFTGLLSVLKSGDGA
jgi:hypothetical protein